MWFTSINRVSKMTRSNFKKAIRLHLIKKRNKLNKYHILDLSQQIVNKVISHQTFINANSIALYYAFNQEVNLLKILNYDKVFSLPTIQNNNLMTFNQVSTLNELVVNKYGMPEPVNGKVINPATIELCLMPLVGFNRMGYRLGMGGGYYDRYFELNKFKKKPTILAGIAYDFQENDTIPSDQWDIPLDIIFTNKEVIIP